MTAKEMNRLDLINIVSDLISKGYTVCDIAKLLNLPESTVRSYRNS